DLRSGRVRDSSEELRRSAGDRQRYRNRPVVRDRHVVIEARVAFQTPRASRHGHGQLANSRCRLSRAVRRSQSLELRSARAGPLRSRVLHHGEDNVHRAMIAAGLPAAIVLIAAVAQSPDLPTLERAVAAKPADIRAREVLADAYLIAGHPMDAVAQLRAA